MDGGHLRGRRRDLDSPDSDDSDTVPMKPVVARYDSDSDSDPKRWTKNPLIVKRVKKGEKNKQKELALQTQLFQNINTLTKKGTK